MSELGAAVARGEYSVSHEHALSAILKFHVGKIIYSFDEENENEHFSIAFAGIEQDYHEFGILMGAMMARHYQFKVYYLGPNLPADALNDAIKFLDPQSDRKIVFIGDPYSLTFGKDEDSALNLETLSELYNKEKIKHFRRPINNIYSVGKEKLRISLATSIEKSLFNNLHYPFDETTLIDLQDDKQRIMNLS